MSRVAKIISMLFLLVFGLGLTACGGSGYNGTGNTTNQTQQEVKPPTQAEIQKKKWDEDQAYGDVDYIAFVKKFPDGTVAHCVARYTSVSCDFTSK